ncbi:tryptophan 2,3-dioxygenase family protein [Streptomyces sp. NPDC091371]|uniref:tryptophan 2,3-dioxygenase family protein n=1 Tax=Streptomyces sp. NPDC091371 TaxID=3155303 RepID=UPI003445D8F1
MEHWATTGHVNGRLDGIRLARIVTEEVRRTGKHFLPPSLLIQLDAIRSRHATDRRPLLRAFLDCLLDKHEERFWNRTYLGLPLLERLSAGPDHLIHPNRLATLLISDVVRYEIQAAASPAESVDRDRPDPATLHKRLRHAVRFVAQDGDEPDVHELTSRVARMPQARWAEIVDLLPRPTATVGPWFDVTVQPVYVLHDEYFFIRALQAHEMLFTAIVTDIRAAISALRDGRLQEGAEHIDLAAGRFDRASALFRIVATMRPGHFSTFRKFTQGASAIQSEQYKRFEILCGVPPVARLRSTAFTSVPAVRAEAEECGHDTVAHACLDLRRRNDFSPSQWHLLDASLGRLEARHQRWKATHRSLAARMLGSAHGSGYTDGVPYLTQCLDNRLFGQLRATR